MNYLFDLIEKVNTDYNRKSSLFLKMTTLIFTISGLVIWFFSKIFIKIDPIYALCFAGYSGIFGYISGIIFLYNKNES